MRVQRSGEAAVVRAEAVALMLAWRLPNPWPCWCMDFSVWASVFPSIQRRNWTRSWIWPCLTVLEVTDESVSDQVENHRSDIQKAHCLARWSLSPTHHGQCIFISPMPYSPLLLKWLPQSGCPAPLDLFPFPKPISAHLLQKASRIPQMGMSTSLWSGSALARVSLETAVRSIHISAVSQGGECLPQRWPAAPKHHSWHRAPRERPVGLTAPPPTCRGFVWGRLGHPAQPVFSHCSAHQSTRGLSKHTCWPHPHSF